MTRSSKPRPPTHDCRQYRQPASGPRTAERHALVARVVANAFDVDEAAVFENRTHAERLIPTVLEQQPAAGFEMRRRAADDAADRVEPIGARRERRARLARQIARVEMRIALGDV